MSYATDGFCHNSEPGTFNHECGKPAVYIGTKKNGFRSGFCAHCKEHGWEARLYIRWEYIVRFLTHGESCRIECSTLEAAQAIWDAAKVQDDVEMKCERPS